MKKIVTFLLAFILLIGGSIFAGGMIAPRFSAKAETISSEMTSQDAKQEIITKETDKSQEKQEDKGEKHTKNITNSTSAIELNKKRKKDKVEKRVFTENDKEKSEVKNINAVENIEENSDKNIENNKKIDKNSEKITKNAEILNKNKINNANSNNLLVNNSLKPTDLVNDNIINRSVATDERMELCIIGNASKSVSPDYAKITAVIETLDSDMVKSKDTNFEIFEKVLKALKDKGIAEEDIVLDSYTSYPSYDYSMGKSLVGYYTLTTFTFNVDNLDNIKSFVDTATENGVTSIRNINYELSNMDEVYQEVLMMAIDNAKAKAEKISGGEVTIKSVKEEYVYSCTSLYRTYAENISQSLVGCIDIEARVSVEFE